MQRDFDPANPELMDRPQPVTRELEQDLEALRKLNRWFGSHSLIRAFLKCWLQPGRTYRVLDLATGYGDIPRMIVDWARLRGCTVQIDAVDQQEATLQLAREASRDFPEIEYTCADALTYTSQLSYDVVLCSLALHHFTEEDAVKLLRNALRLSQENVLVADLERNAITSAAVWLVTATLFREPMTQHDARASARGAFSHGELAALATRAGWDGFGHQRFFPARQAIWLSQRTAAATPLLDQPPLDFAT